VNWSWLSIENVGLPQLIALLNQRFKLLLGVLQGFASYPILSTETGVTKRWYPYGDVRRFGATGDGVADDTAAFVALQATGRAIYLPGSHTFRINSPVTVSGDIVGDGFGTQESAILLTGTGQLISGSDNLHWSGFHIKSAVSGLTFIKVITNSFRMDNFVMEGTGGATTQVGFQFDTTASVYFASVTKFRFISVAFPMKVTGAGNFNNNHLGEPGDSWLQ